MSAKFYTLLTDIGAAKLASAAALGVPLKITQMAVGDGGGVLPTPSAQQTKLITEKRRASLNMLYIDPQNSSQIIAEQVIPETEGGWWIREVGLFDDTGAMIAVGNCPESYKPQLAEGSGRTQTVRMVLITSSTDNITLKIDPSVVLATRQYVDSKVIEVRSYVDEKLQAHEQSRNHPDASTIAKGFVQLSSSVTSDSETQAATAKAVKIAMDNANARLAKERNLADLPNTALARQNLGLGGSATCNVGTAQNTVAAGDDARITGAMQKGQNGADIQDIAKFIQNLGLGTAAMKDVGTALDQLPQVSSFSTGDSHAFRLPTGHIVQFGTGTVEAGGFTKSYPIPFPRATIVLIGIVYGSMGFTWTATPNTFDRAAANINFTNSTGNALTNQPVGYLAVGY
ncbi:phage tail protein [Cedecea davisae]|uniref:phage tail protein n=1 Tax=Cedecea davisae TaxID=158484 RepID=UPI00209F90AA|nr:phage tail protein [Cedecea davisae]